VLQYNYASGNQSQKGSPAQFKKIDLELPRNQLVLITGPSGSGKSSLAFDTLFAEGQRRYLECLSAYARQFIDQLENRKLNQLKAYPRLFPLTRRPLLLIQDQRLEP